MKIFIWKDLDQVQRTHALARPQMASETSLIDSVKSIVEAVRQRGDAAIKELGEKFDKVRLENLKVPADELLKALNTLNSDLLNAIHCAKRNIEIFHKAQYPKTIKTTPMPGVACELHWRPLDTVGLYIPGGSAPLFSAVLMQAIPALLVGCRRIVLCSPPQKNGKIHPAILATASICGVTEVYAIGGAQAIAAMAYGTETVPKVDKIFGPGNAFVTLAKQLVSQDHLGAALDLPAGPSEVMVIARPPAHASWVAADLLAQAEHDPLAQSVLVTTDVAFANEVAQEVEVQMNELARKDIVRKSIKESRIVVAETIEAAIDISNLYAPEHLIIHDSDAEALLPNIRNAGSVFLGPWTPESAGDYASGTNHVLPTYGYARAYSGLTVLSFMKSMTVQSLTVHGLKELGPYITTMADMEGLDGHAMAVRLRLKSF